MPLPHRRDPDDLFDTGPSLSPNWALAARIAAFSPEERKEFDKWLLSPLDEPPFFLKPQKPDLDPQ